MSSEAAPARSGASSRRQAVLKSTAPGVLKSTAPGVLTGLIAAIAMPSLGDAGTTSRRHAE